MSLSDYTPPTKAVASTGIVVRGLNLNDVAVLVREHFPDLDALWEIVSSAMGGSLTAEGFGRVTTALVSNAPGFAANLIALGAGEPDKADKAQELPAGLQIAAVNAIFELTFADVGGPGKATETITGLLKLKTKTISGTKPTTAR